MHRYGTAVRYLGAYPYPVASLSRCKASLLAWVNVYQPVATRAVHLGTLELSTLPPKNLRGAAVESRTIFFGVGMS